MMNQLVKLPGNLLRSLVGVLPHDNPENGQSKTGYTDEHFKSWCESMGGKVSGDGMCSFEMKDTDYRKLHQALFQKMNEPGITDEGIMNSNAFIDAYNEYMAGKP
jgi:hypothetical protein